MRECFWDLDNVEFVVWVGEVVFEGFGVEFDEVDFFGVEGDVFFVWVLFVVVIGEFFGVLDLFVGDGDVCYVGG